mmetsp:Transcript_27961/g.24636  ORF Transcript_27961/g.24636 Transcript_27961/m.24636 type:complete len:102 (-) Transcript_27961:279-584(-)
MDKEVKNNLVIGDGIVNDELFNNCLNLLVNGNMANKLDALFFINDIMTSELSENKEFLKERADSLVQALHIVMKQLFDKPKSETPIKFIMHFLEMILRLCN